MRFYNRKDFEIRNQPCTCGSGKKYKTCCYKGDECGMAAVAVPPTRPKPRLATRAALANNSAEAEC